MLLLDPTRSESGRGETPTGVGSGRRRLSSGREDCNGTYLSLGLTVWGVDLLSQRRAAGLVSFPGKKFWATHDMGSRESHCIRVSLPSHGSPGTEPGNKHSESNTRPATARAR